MDGRKYTVISYIVGSLLNQDKSSYMRLQAEDDFNYINKCVWNFKYENLCMSKVPVESKKLLLFVFMMNARILWGVVCL